MIRPPDLSQRSNEAEIMDDLTCSGQVVEQTLRELDVINRWLGGNKVTLDGLKSLIHQASAKGVAIVTIVDLGCGSGELLRQAAEFGRRNKIKLQLIGFDANPHIIDFARKHCENYPEIAFEAVNVLSDDFSVRSFDVITGTLFFHHFDDTTLSLLLARLNRQARVAILINDIHRHWFAYQSIRMLTQLLSKSSMVRFDAPLSVRRAFTLRDWRRILSSAGIVNYTIDWKWAFRWKIVIQSLSLCLAQFW